MMTIQIYVPNIRDKQQWLPLWHGYVEFYKTNIEDDVSAYTWQRFFDDAEPLYIVCAYDEEKMVGFATYLIHPNTWSKAPYCYLEDLFVDDAARGNGVATQLIQSVVADAKQRQCTRVYWYTQEHNKTARALYDKVADLSDFIQYRIAL